jgi:hypothetical protein
MIILMYPSGVPFWKTFTNASYVGESFGFDQVLNSSNFQVSSGLFSSSSGYVKGIGVWIIPLLPPLVACYLFWGLVSSCGITSGILYKNEFFEATYLNNAVPVKTKQNGFQKVFISTFCQSSSRFFILFPRNVIVIRKTVDWRGNLRCTFCNLLCLNNQSGNWCGNDCIRNIFISSLEWYIVCFNTVLKRKLLGLKQVISRLALIGNLRCTFFNSL